VKITGEFGINNVYQGNCIELLKSIADESVNLIFADPPYNLQLNGKLYCQNQTKVDDVLDDWDKFESKEKYDEFPNSWLKECYRVLKKSGSFWVIGTYHNIFRSRIS
jgi:DNA modification methylase